MKDLLSDQRGERDVTNLEENEESHCSDGKAVQAAAVPKNEEKFTKETMRQSNMASSDQLDVEQLVKNSWFFSFHVISAAVSSWKARFFLETCQSNSTQIKI